MPGASDILLPEMATIDLNELSAYVAVVRCGSFTAAARAAGTQKAHLSRVVSRLEQRLGVRLLQRSTRSLAMTEVGRDFYERAAGILAAIDETAAIVQGSLREPQGVLRLTCAVDLGVLLVNRWIGAFLRRYPQVRVDAELSNRTVDLIHEGFDLAVRVGPLADSALSARKLGEVRCLLYASPAYLRGLAAPRHPRDLGAHQLLMFSVSRPPSWPLAKGAERYRVTSAARFVSDNHIVVRDAAVEGLGITLLPRFMARDLVRRGRLVQVLPGWAGPSLPIHAVIASSRYLAPKVRAFVELATASALDL
jgi:LysR family transcriptional regulator for bpeEF and oprC